MKDIHSKNYYELLGITREATKEEIKTAYKSIALVYHPDSNFFSEIIEDKPACEENEVFKQLTAAYSTLIDAAKRSEYDDSLPPELPSWDSERLDVIGKKITSYGVGKDGNTGATSAAFGVFGSQQYDEYQEEEEYVEEPVTASMSDIIFRQKDSFWSKVRSLFAVRS